MDLVYLFLLLIIAHHLRTSNSDSGLHKSRAKLLSFEKCKHPDPPLDKKYQEKLKEYFTTYTKNGKIIIKGNVTLYQDMVAQANFMAGVEMQNKKFQYKIKLNKMSCKNILAKLVLLSLVKFNAKTCVVSKGQYQFDNVDVAKIESAVTFVPVREVGINKWYFGFYGPEGTYSCFDIRILVQ